MRYVDIVVYDKDANKEKYHSVIRTDLIAGATKNAGDNAFINVNGVSYTLITAMFRTKLILNGEVDDIIQMREVR